MNNDVAPQKFEDTPIPAWSEVSLAKAYLGKLEEVPVLAPEVIIQGLLSYINHIEQNHKRYERLLTLIETSNEKLYSENDKLRMRLGE